MNDTHRAMLTELLDDDSDTMSAWELDFIDNLNRWTGELRPAQADKLEQIWAKVFGG